MKKERHSIRKINPSEAASLIAELDSYLGDLYPAESNHLDSIEELCRDHVTMFGALENETIIGIGAVKCMQSYGEIKRLYVPRSQRGRKLSKTIMDALENHLLNQGIDTARLEVGIHQPEAITLYRNSGYVERSPFGEYQPDPLSLFMEKKLTPPPEAAGSGEERSKTHSLS